MKILLIVYDNESHIHLFPIGTGHIASVLRERGHEVVVYNQDVYHSSEEHLTKYLDNNNFDVVGLGFIAGYWQYRKVLSISRAIAASDNRPDYYVLAGHGPTPEPEYFLEKTKADIVVMGEGEETVLEVMEQLSLYGLLSNVKGIAYKSGKDIFTNPRRPPIKDIDSIPFPAYDLFPIEYYRLMRLPHCTPTDFLMPVLSARGCTFQCNFCYRMDKGYRMRSVEGILDEVEFLQKDYGITYIDFADELLMSSKGRVVELCEAILKSGLKFKWFCNGRLNYATKEIVALMKRVGCVFINYGIEAFDNAVLENMDKHLITEQIVSGIEATLKAGVSPGFNIIFGNIGDNAETLQKGVEFLLKYDDGAQLRTIRPVTPYPGSPLYYHAIEQGLLKGVEDFYENKHVNSDLLTVNFTNLSDKEFYAVLEKANLTLLKNYYGKKFNRAESITRNLYGNRDASFRGYRQS